MYSPADGVFAVIQHGTVFHQWQLYHSNVRYMAIKILECIRQGQIGGGETHLLSLVENLDRNRFDPIVLSFTDGPMVDRLKSLQVPTTVIHTEKPFDIGKWGKVKRYLQKQQVELIHAHGTRANSNVLWAARSLGLPVVYTIHGWSFHNDQQFLVKKIRMWGEQFLVHKSTLNISVSASNQQTGLDAFPHFKSVVVNNGIDQNKFNPERTFKNIREELNIPTDKILVLFIARYTAHKQPLALIRAFAAAVEENDRLHLLMVGDGDEKANAIQLIEDLKISQQVTLQSFRQDVPDVLAAADIFVLPSLWEGLPIGLLEAMSMGKAVIGTNVDGTKEVIVDQHNGLLIEAGDLEALKKAILDLASHPEKRNQLAKEARATVQHRFNAASMTRQIEDLYDGVLQNRKS